MAKKNITFRIDETLIEKLNELRGGASQNMVLEALLTNWNGETTSTSTSTSTSNDLQVQVQLQAQTEALEKLQAQVQLIVNQQSQVQVQVIAKEEPKPKKEKSKPVKPVVFVPTPDEIVEEDDYDQSMGGLFHLVPKTHKVGKPERQMKQYHEGPISWMVLEGCRAHYDKHGKPIPFRITGEDGTVWEADAEELQEISRAYGKQVMIEE